MKFLVVVLICAGSDHTCSPGTAISMTVLGKAASPMMCLGGAEMTMARTAIAAGAGEWQKTECVRTAVHVNRDVRGALVAVNE